LSVLAFGGVLFSNNDADATGTIFPVPADTLQMSCSIGSIATVKAGDGIAPGPTFPVIVNCPGECPGGPTVPGQYAKWDFTFDFLSASTPRTATLQVAADVTIEETNPPATVLNSGAEDLLNGILNDFDSKFIKFSATSDPFYASYYTKPNFAPRIEGAGVKAGFLKVGQCRLAGAGTRFGSPAEAATVSANVQAGPCSFTKVTDGRGCTVSLTLTSGNPGVCVLTDNTVVLSGDSAPPLSAGTKCADVQLSFEGSCKYCYVTSTGALKCVTNTSVASCPK
jgi:hypothetical protein